MKKITKSSLSDQIFDYIKDEIAKGTWKPGEKLPSETELAADLGVSRMSLRSAIQRSNVMGLTETKVGEGTFVRAFNLRSYFGDLYRCNLIGKSANEINDLRCILQIGSARLALETPVPAEDLETLENLYSLMELAANSNDFDRFHTADIMFHRSLVRICKNELIYMIYDAVEATVDDVTQQNMRYSVKYTSNFDTALAHHRELLEAVKTQNVDQFIHIIMESRARSYSYYASAEAQES